MQPRLVRTDRRIRLQQLELLTTLETIVERLRLQATKLPELVLPKVRVAGIERVVKRVIQKVAEPNQRAQLDVFDEGAQIHDRQIVDLLAEQTGIGCVRQQIGGKLFVGHAPRYYEHGIEYARYFGVSRLALGQKRLVLFAFEQSRVELGHRRLAGRHQIAHLDH